MPGPQRRMTDEQVLALVDGGTTTAIVARSGMSMPCIYKRLRALEAAGRVTSTQDRATWGRPVRWTIAKEAARD